MEKVIAIVTGASSGLGRGFVQALDGGGASVSFDEIWVIARRADRLQALQQGVNTRIVPLPLDLTAAQAIPALQEALAKESEACRQQQKTLAVRMLINAAGFGKIGDYSEVDTADNMRMVDLNCRTPVAVTQTVLPFMPNGARIMQVCSTAAFQPFTFLSVYAASKAFLYRYSRALRVELFPRKIGVTAVCPYWIKDTEFIATAQKNADASRIKGFPFAQKQDAVVRRAMRDTKLGLAVSTPGFFCTFHRVVAKIIPSEIMLGFWALLRRI